MMKFEIFTEKLAGLTAISPEYFVRLIANNHLTIAITGDGYTSKLSARHAAGRLQGTNLSTPVWNVVALPSPFHGERFEIRLSPAGLGKSEFRWRYFGRNGELIAHSGEGYNNEADCRQAIDFIKSTNFTTPITVLA